MRYPIVLIHGLYGYGHEDEVKNSDLLPYWGYKENNLVEHLQNEGYEVHYPSLGPYNSAWDRACILWAYLFGGRVDYGEAHSRIKGHKRFGDTYPGVLKDLGKTKAHAKIELFGHSFGGATVKEASSLFTQGDEQEKKLPGHSPLRKSSWAVSAAQPEVQGRLLERYRIQAWNLVQHAAKDRRPHILVRSQRLHPRSVRGL